METAILSREHNDAFSKKWSFLWYKVVDFVCVGQSLSYFGKKQSFGFAITDMDVNLVSKGRDGDYLVGHVWVLTFKAMCTGHAVWNGDYQNGETFFYFIHVNTQ